jgi:hypothetical protein
VGWERSAEETAQPAQQIGLNESDLAWPAVADLEVTAAELDGFEQEVRFDDRTEESDSSTARTGFRDRTGRWDKGTPIHSHDGAERKRDSHLLGLPASYRLSLSDYRNSSQFLAIPCDALRGLQRERRCRKVLSGKVSCELSVSGYCTPVNRFVVGSSPTRGA